MNDKDSKDQAFGQPRLAREETPEELAHRFARETRPG
jgi:hypothetical protein